MYYTLLNIAFIIFLTLIGNPKQMPKNTNETNNLNIFNIISGSKKLYASRYNFKNKFANFLYQSPFSFPLDDRIALGWLTKIFVSFTFPSTVVPYQSTIFKRLNNNDCWYHMLWAFYIEQRWVCESHTV